MKVSDARFLVAVTVAGAALSGCGGGLMHTHEPIVAAPSAYGTAAAGGAVKVSEQSAAPSASPSPAPSLEGAPDLTSPVPVPSGQSVGADGTIFYTGAAPKSMIPGRNYQPAPSEVPAQRVPKATGGGPALPAAAAGHGVLVQASGTGRAEVGRFTASGQSTYRLRLACPKELNLSYQLVVLGTSDTGGISGSASCESSIAGGSPIEVGTSLPAGATVQVIASTTQGSWSFALDR